MSTASSGTASPRCRSSSSRRTRASRGSASGRTWTSTVSSCDRGRGPARGGRAVRPHAGPCVQGRTRGCDVRRHRRTGHGALGLEGEDRRRAPWRTLGRGTGSCPRMPRRWRSRSPTTSSTTCTASAVARGFTSVKVKGGLNLDSDLVRFGRVRDIFSVNTPRPGIMLDANRVLEPQAGDPIHPRCRGEGRPVLGRGAVAAVGRRRHGNGQSRCSRRGRHRREPDRSGAVQAASGRWAVDIVQVGSMWGSRTSCVSRPSLTAVTCPSVLVGSTANPVFHAAAAVPNHLSAECRTLEPRSA